MIHRDELIETIHTYLGKDLIQQAQAIDTHLANGVQILGKEEVSCIVVGVSATMEFFREAKKRNADFIIVKHPISLETHNFLMDPSLQSRLREVFHNQWTLAGYHNVLDVHDEVGNVPILMKKLGINGREPFAEGWGYVGVFDEPQNPADLASRLQTVVNHQVFQVLPSSTKKITKVGVVSGGGIPRTDRLAEIVEKRLDLYITGEISEWTVHQFNEIGVAYFAAGHHATEVLGPQALADKLTALVDGKATVEFVNVWNEI